MALEQYLDDEQLALIDGVREFAQQVVAPVSARHDPDKIFPYEN